MLQGEIQRALQASRVVPLGVPNPHGPLGLEQLAAAVASVRAESEDFLIPIRRQTRESLEELAQAETEANHRSISAAELAAAVVELFVSSAKSR
jgi:hypothetical protein